MSSKHSRYVETNLKPYQKSLAAISRLAYHSLAEPEIKKLADGLRQRVLEGDPAEAAIQSRLAELLPKAYALVCAAVRKAFGWTVFDSQLLAAIAMQSGRIIELDTGEGKTLAAVFPAFLQCLAGRGVHVLTFNDYLARRDAVWMGPVYKLLGVRVDNVLQGMDPEQRRLAYQADVTYLTAKEAGFDYLRGFLASTPEKLVQRPFNFAIVDEADSILIDEARIPLVIAGGQSGAGSIEPALVQMVSRMKPELHYRLDEYADHVLITEYGVTWLERNLNIPNLYEPGQVGLLSQIHLILQANVLLKRDVDYIVRDGSIQLVDEFTGRVIQNRQWPDGLHEAVEIKEGLSGRSRGRILNRITLRDFLGLYPGLCGMTGTAWSAAPELDLFYGLRVTRIPPHVPCKRLDLPDLIFGLRQEKETAVIREVKRRHDRGQPVLVGTASVEESERLALLARDSGLTCEVLNARQDEAEAAVIARAGSRGAITISTNMAGRGVDIHLEDPSGGGLYVIGTNRHRSVRIDNQLRGRSGRQGDPGESRFFVSLQDDLIERYHIRSVLPPAYQQLSPAAPAKTTLEVSDPVPIRDRAVAEAVNHTQRVVEGQLFQQRQALGRYSQLVEDQRRMIHQLHEDILTSRKILTIWQDSDPGLYEELLRKVSAAEIRRAQQQAGAMMLSQGWADYLELVEQLLDHVSMMRSGPNDPFITFNRQIIDAYTHFLDIFEADMVELFSRLTIQDGQISLADNGLQDPPSTRTYLIDDGSDTLEQTLGIDSMVAAAANPAGFLMALAARRFRHSGDQTGPDYLDSE